MANGLDVALMEYLEEDEVDNIKALLAYMLLENTGLDDDRVYSLVFHSGKKITWH
jgi:hypothetical protein